MPGVARGRSRVEVTGDDRSVIVRWGSAQIRVLSVVLSIVVFSLPAFLCLIPIANNLSSGVVLVCAAIPVVLTVLTVLAASRGRMELRVSPQGIERRGVNGFGIPLVSSWPAPVAIHVAPLWNFTASGSITGFDQYHVGFMRAPGIAVEVMMLDPESTNLLVAGVRRLNTPAITLEVRSLMPDKPSTLCACGYDLIGVPVRVCPECGTAIDVNRFEVLQRMHSQQRAEKAANQSGAAGVEETDKEHP